MDGMVPAIAKANLFIFTYAVLEVVVIAQCLTTTFNWRY